MTVLRDSAIMGAATFLVGAVFMEVGDDEQDFDKTFPYIATFLSGAIGYYLLKKTNITDSFSAEDDVVSSYMDEAIAFMKKTGSTKFDWTDMEQKQLEEIPDWNEGAEGIKKRAIKAAAEIRNKYMIEDTYDSSYQAFWFKYKGMIYYINWYATDPTLYQYRDRLAQQRLKKIMRGNRKAKKNIQRKILMGAEEKVKTSKLKGKYGDRIKFSYRGHEAIYNYDDGDKEGDLRFINNFDERRMGKGDWLPHVKKIRGIKGKAKNPRHYFKQYLDRPCESCDEPIYKYGIGNCSFSYDDFDKEFKYEIKTPEGEDFVDSYLNRYCRKCLYFMGVGGTTNMPNDFDRKSSNYALGNALSEEAFNEFVEENYPVELAEGKKIPKHSLYDIENYNARREMALRRKRKD